MKNIILSLFLLLSGCASYEKHHSFRVDRADAASQAFAVCKQGGNWRDPILVGSNQFYVQHEVSPYWAGVLFLPIFPFKLNFDEIRLNFGSDVPLDPEAWSIQFESDGYIAKGQVESVPSGQKAYQMIFRFPSRSQTDRFVLNIPAGTGVKKVKIVEEAYWKYHPIFLPYGDTFPRWQDCQH